MSKFIDLTGRRFGRWLVLGRLEPKTNWPKPRWRVQCDCGVISDVYGSPLAGGRSTSCGCGPVGRHAIHGMDGTPEYRAWSGMWARCTNPHNASYKRYGGRGITVSEEWEDFRAFLADMGRRPSRGHSLERKENDGNYEKDNCRWATDKEQANNRSTNRRITALGRSMTMSQWAELTGVSADMIARRLDFYGWSADDSVSVPLKARNVKKTKENTQCET